MNELLSLLQSKNLMNVIDTCVFDIDGTLCEDVKFNLLSPDERTYVKYFDDMAVIVNEIKDKKIRKKEKDIFKSLQGRFIHIKVGNSTKPAEKTDIDEMQNKFDKYMEQNDIDCIAFVTHHAVEIQVI